MWSGSHAKARRGWPSEILFWRTQADDAVVVEMPVQHAATEEIYEVTATWRTYMYQSADMLPGSAMNKFVKVCPGTLWPSAPNTKIGVQDCWSEEGCQKI